MARSRPVAVERSSAAAVPAPTAAATAASATAVARRSSRYTPPLWTSATAWTSYVSPGGSLPEDPAVQRVLDVVHVVGPEAGGEVLPAAVADDAHDGAAGHLRRDPRAGVDDRAGGHAREDPLLGGEATRHEDGVAVRDEQLPVEPREVEDRRDEPVVEAAQAADRVALQRLARHHLDLRAVLLEA